MSNRLLRNANDYIKSVLTYEKLDNNNNYNLLLNKMDGSDPVTLIDTRYWNRNVILQAFGNQGNVTIPLNSSTGDIVFNLPESIKDDAVNKVYGLETGNRLLYSDENIQDQYVGNITITIQSVGSKRFGGQDYDCLIIDENTSDQLNALSPCYIKHPELNNNYLLTFVLVIQDTEDLSNNSYCILLNDQAYTNVYSGTNFDIEIYKKIPIREIKESNIEIDSEDEFILNGDNNGDTYFWTRGTLPQSNFSDLRSILPNEMRIYDEPYNGSLNNYPPLSNINIGFGLGRSYAGIYFLRDGDQVVMNGNNNVSRYIAKPGWILKFDPCRGTIENDSTIENDRPRGLITFDRDVQITKDLAVIDGATTLNYLSVINEAVFEQNLIVNRTFTARQNLVVNRNATLNSNLLVGGNTTLNGTLTTSGNTNLNGTLTVANTATFNNNIILRNDLIFGTNLTTNLVIKNWTSNINTIDQTGLFIVNLSDTSDSLLGSSGLILSLVNGNIRVQFLWFIANTDGPMFYKRTYNNSWSSWYKTSWSIVQ